MNDYDTTIRNLDERIDDAKIELEELREERNEIMRLRRDAVHAEIIAARDASPNGCVRFTTSGGRVVDRFPWNDGGTRAMFVGVTPGEVTDRLEYDDVLSAEPVR